MQLSAWSIPGLREKAPVRYSNQQIVDRIKKATLDFFALTPEQVFCKSRKRELTLARQIMMYLVRKHSSLSLIDIGVHIHNGKPMDHTTVIHSIQTLKDLIQVDEVIPKHVQAIESKAILDMIVTPREAESLKVIKVKRYLNMIAKAKVSGVEAPIRETFLSESEKIMQRYL